MRLGARVRTLAFVFAQLLCAVTALAEYRHRVVVLSAQATQDPVRVELEARLRGELTAAGIDVVVVPAPDAVDVRDAVETSARELSPSAVIGLREPSGTSPELTNVEVWISDRLSGRTLVQRAQLSGTRSSQIALLAVQVSELFKARLGLLWIEPVPPAPHEPDVAPPVPAATPPPLEPAPVTPPLPTRPRFLVGAGVGLLHQLNDSISSWFPALQLGIEPSSTGWAALALRANVGFTPGHSEVERTAARARVTQGWGLAQGSVRFTATGPVQPTLSLGAGVYSVDVQGDASAPETSRAERTWTAAATLGIGIWVQTNDAFAFVIEGQALSAWSKTVVRIRGEEAASFGFPAALVSASWIGRY